MSNNNDYATDNLIDLAYSKENYKLIAINLTKQIKLKDPQPINFTGKLENQINANVKLAFKNCAPFRDCRTEINETFVDKTEHINTAMPMYNLIEYSENYSDTSRSLWQFKS